MASSVFSRVPSSLKTTLKYGSAAFAGFWGGEASIWAYQYKTMSTADFVTTFAANPTGRIDVDVSGATTEQKEQWTYAFKKSARYFFKEDDKWSLKSTQHDPNKDETMTVEYKDGKIESWSWRKMMK